MTTKYLHFAHFVGTQIIFHHNHRMSMECGMHMKVCLTAQKLYVHNFHVYRVRSARSKVIYMQNMSPPFIKQTAESSKNSSAESKNLDMYDVRKGRQTTMQA